ncbi:bifunctional riboflavin kinase/FAD synthetase [Clostridium sp. Cult3]|uniref:bifunctional riboflavin kinase/FAD synthetase n=1 Tax=Clostridium sp. Cult3 TaxID=2079004 RepID=UPI001F012135|nr:bifunctional riboflavin kinase/FAD synthetase [Clostridium sp. Cult3]
MEIIDLNIDEKSNYKTAVALGNFDGIHFGHKYLIEDTVKKAKHKKLKPGVLLFRNHTKTILNNDRDSIPILTSNEQKLKILEELGVEVVYIIDFDESLMKLSSEEFVENIIIGKLNAKLITVGFDYRFGYKAMGNSEYLKELGKKEGFETNIVMPITIEDQIVSSTIIRNLLMKGQVEKANKFLGRYYTILGHVVEGSSRGTKLGYPTANIRLDDNYVIPKIGVYKTITIVDSKQYLSLTNIGYNPTFNENKLKIENHILNFNKNIYGQLIEVLFVNFIRDDIKFNSAKELIDQIKSDIYYIKAHQ